MNRINLVVISLALFSCLVSPQKAVAGQGNSIPNKFMAKKIKVPAKEPQANCESSVTYELPDMTESSEKTEGRPHGIHDESEALTEGSEEYEKQDDTSNADPAGIEQEYQELKKELTEIAAREAEVTKENKALKFELEKCKLRLAALDGVPASGNVADHQELNILNDCNQNRLHITIRSNDLAEASRLIKAGINLNQADLNDRTPIRYAIQQQLVTLV
jgi:hypothetical protein